MNSAVFCDDLVDFSFLCYLSLVNSLRQCFNDLVKILCPSAMRLVNYCAHWRVVALVKFVARGRG